MTAASEVVKMAAEGQYVSKQAAAAACLQVRQKRTRNASFEHMLLYAISVNANDGMSDYNVRKERLRVCVYEAKNDNSTEAAFSRRRHLER